MTMTPTPFSPLLLVAAAALTASHGGLLAAAESSAGGDAVVESCPLWTWLKGGMPFEHTDEACNRAVENDLRRAAKITKALEASVNTGSARQLKDEKTGYCPAEDFGDDADWNDSDPQSLSVGPPSLWILRNGASTPVVVSWVAPASNAMNLEVSAVNPKIYPAHNDPKAVMQPGDWMRVEVRLGQIFHVRELINVGGGQYAPGRILVRHRPGPIPIKNRFGGEDEPLVPEPLPFVEDEPEKKSPVDLECPVQALADPKPKPPPPPKSKKEKPPPPAETKTPAYDHNKPCNAIPVVFVNRMDCPVDVYYAGVEGSRILVDPTPEEASAYKNETSSSSAVASEEGGANRKKASSCEEVHSFHLGVNPASDSGSAYFEKWDSPVVFMYTYLTHKFVARLRHDKDKVVDEIVIDRTIVEDCPNRRTAAAAARVADGEGVMVGVHLTDKQGKKAAASSDVEVGPDGEVQHDIVVTGTFKSTTNSTSTAPSAARNATGGAAAAADPEGATATAAAAAPEAASASDARANVLTSS